jgi:hypothetical protein
MRWEFEDDYGDWWPMHDEIVDVLTWYWRNGMRPDCLEVRPSCMSVGNYYEYDLQEMVQHRVKETETGMWYLASRTIRVLELGAWPWEMRDERSHPEYMISTGIVEWMYAPTVQDTTTVRVNRASCS